MIKIGSTIIDTIKIGSTTPDHIDVGSTQVWPDSTQYYITLDPATVLIMYGQQSGGTINVSTNAPSWSVAVSPANSYITASKQNGNITWSIDANTGNTSRNAYITASYGNVSAQTTVYQNNGYAIYIEGGNDPRTVSSGGTNNLTISVISKYGNDAVAVSSASTQTWVRCTSMTNVGSGKYVFVFTVDLNTDSQTRHATLTFTQTQGTGKSTSIMITQPAMYVPETIPGFQRFNSVPGQGFTENGWQIGRYQAGTTTIDGQTVPLYAVALVTTEVSQAMYDNVATVVATGSTRVQATTYPWYIDNNAISIPAYSTVTINGNSVYGVMLKSPSPNQQLTNVSTLSVSRATQ